MCHSCQLTEGAAPVESTRRYTSDGLAYIWEVIELVRKLILTSFIAVAFDPDSYVQIVFGIIMAFFFLWLTEHVRPFQDPSDHFLTQVSYFVVAITLVLGMALRSLDNEISDRSAQEIESDREVIGVAMIVFNCSIIALILWELVALFVPRVSVFEKLRELSGTKRRLSVACDPLPLHCMHPI